MLVIAVYSTPHGRMVLVTDEDLVGRSFVDQEDGYILMVPESIYSGKLVEEDEAALEISRADIIVATGEKAVGLVVGLGLASPESVISIRGVPHVQVYKLSSDSL